MNSVDRNKYEKIQQQLKELERARDITIIHAVESGSRAWGFPSKDSDYDVRIIYHHTPEWYISPFSKKDNLEIPITSDLDIAGWDVAKTLNLLYRGNATVHEWLNSPIVYHSTFEKYALLREFSLSEFNPSPAFYHYISLAKKKLSDEQTQLNAKAFLYGLRALLCANWIADTHSSPPVLFSRLTERYLDTITMGELKTVLQEKEGGKEKDPFKIPNNLWYFSIEGYQKISASLMDKKKQGNRDSYENILRKVVM